jgi:hypothetical protein
VLPPLLVKFLPLDRAQPAVVSRPGLFRSACLTHARTAVSVQVKVLRHLRDRPIAALAQLDDLGLKSGVNERRGRGFFLLPMLSMLDILPRRGARPGSRMPSERLNSKGRIAPSSTN